MKFKFTFVASIIAMVLGALVFFLIKDRAIYLLYGYPPGIEHEYTAESFQALQRTYGARLIVFYSIFATTIFCFTLSCIALYRRVYISYALTQIGFVLSLILSIFYLFVAIATHFLPKRTF